MLADPALAQGYRCDGTWFAGVNALENDATGAVPGRVPPLSGAAVAFVRCAAHVDGLERSMPDRRRRLSETHSFLLGIPLGEAGEDEGAFVVWRGSHEIMRAAFAEAYAGHDPADWFGIDITDPYVAAPKRCFEVCEPVRIAPGMGAAYVMHPLALHGVAPWEGAGMTPRMVAYFRPDAFAGDPARWITA